MRLTNFFNLSRKQIAAWIAGCLLSLTLANASVAQEPACNPTPAPACDDITCPIDCCEQPCSDESSDLGEPCRLSDLFKDDCGNDPWLNIGGWTQWGYTSDSTGLFNSHPHRFNNHQTYLYLEKVADGSDGLDWGFRADVVYGVDAQDTQAFGASNSWDNKTPYQKGIYGWAMPQLYAELAAGDWSVKMGHFYTLIGYEVVTAPDNFFYSHAFTMYNSEPFTHSGVLASYNVNEDITVYGGWTAGWDTGFDRFDKGSNFLGGISAKVTDNVTLTYMTTVGDFGLRGEGYMHSIVADVQLTDNLNYVIQSDMLEVNFNAAPAVPPAFTINHTIGINQYLFYTINDYVKVGGRLEWWKANGESIYNATAGVNIKPHANVTIRPEIRKQWGSERIGLPTDDTITAIDAIITF